MSEITPTTAKPQSTINDANTASNRNQSGGSAAPAATPPGGTTPTDTVTISAAAQATGGQGGDSQLTDSEAQSTASTLRQQIGLNGLSASARQNASVLALLRPGR
ncbi:MAG: hypothetical protein WDN69_35045 [Aliidongia sp.]